MEKLINNFKISFTKGDTYALAVKIKNITEDLRTAYFTVKENPDDEPLIQKSLGAGIAKIDDRAYKDEKTYKLQLQAEDTINLEANVQYLYDFQVAVGNVVKTLLSGVFVVNHSVSGASSINTSTLDVTVDDELEAEFQTTPPANGVEFEEDPVANAKIGDMTALETTAKETLVQAINEVANAKVVSDKIGDMTALETTNKDTLVQAINEIESDATANKNDIDGLKSGTVKAGKSISADYTEGLLNLNAEINAKQDYKNDITLSGTINGYTTQQITIGERIEQDSALPANDIYSFSLTGINPFTVDQVVYYRGERGIIRDLTLLKRKISVPAGGAFAQQSGNKITVGIPTSVDIDAIIPPYEEYKNTVSDTARIKNGTIAVPKASNATNATKVNSLEIKQDSNGVLKIGDIIIPQKKLIWSGNVECSEEQMGKVELKTEIQDGDKLTIVFDLYMAGSNEPQGIDYEVKFRAMSKNIQSEVFCRDEEVCYLSFNSILVNTSKLLIKGIKNSSGGSYKIAVKEIYKIIE